MTLDADDRQWIELGIHREACLTRPDTCGIRKGGALSMWIQLQSADRGGIITTQNENSGNVGGFTVNTGANGYIT